MRELLARVLVIGGNTMEQKFATETAPQTRNRPMQTKVSRHGGLTSPIQMTCSAI